MFWGNSELTTSTLDTHLYERPRPGNSSVTNFTRDIKHPVPASRPNIPWLPCALPRQWPPSYCALTWFLFLQQRFAQQELSTSLSVASVQGRWSLWKAGFPTALGWNPGPTFHWAGAPSRSLPAGRACEEVTPAELHVHASLPPFFVVLVTQS